MSSNTRTALVIGATGMLGTGIVDHLAKQGTWNIVALSRNAENVTWPAWPKGVVPVNADLLDKQILEKALQPHNITHLFIASLFIKEDRDNGDQDVIDLNFAMVRNIMEVLTSGSKSLEGVLLVTGGKYYGCHLGPEEWKDFHIPFEEDHPKARHPNPDFYFVVEDYVRDQGAIHGYHWSIVRPGYMAGVARRSTMIAYPLVTMLPFYATVLKEQGLPLIFPGSEKAFKSRTNGCHTNEVARLSEWAVTTPSCNGQAFNATNDETFSFGDLWPKFGEFFGMDVAVDPTFDVEDFFKDVEQRWSTICTKHKLKQIDMERVFDVAAIGWLNVGFDTSYSAEKRHLFGFPPKGGNPNLDMFLDVFRKLQRENVLPVYNMSRL